MAIRLLSHEAFLVNVRTRFPFRYGIASLTACPHLFLRCRFDIDGQPATGFAADNLPPKWFTKDPEASYRDEVRDMIGVIRSACEFATAMPPSPTVFAFWRALCEGQSNLGVPTLLSNFGTSLVERAAISAFCAAVRRPFAEALRLNLFGLTDVPFGLLPAQPLRKLIVRHTVGLTDPLTDRDIPATDRVDDGLPQSLERCIEAYGLTHFKIKLSGNLRSDKSRLRKIAEMLGRKVPHYAFTLDGNENFQEIELLRRLWDSLASDGALDEFLSRLIFLEQPLHRDVALSDRVQSAMLAWEDRPPIIIDESDCSIDSLPRALACGYVGTSHKNCKGVFKGVINACRLARLREENAARPFILSGEDLTNLGPVALGQDLAVMASLGLTHIERNGHHYFRGISHLPPEVQRAALEAQPDLYTLHPGGFIATRIEEGAMNAGSCIDAPFGVAFAFDPSAFTPLDAWSFDSM